MQPRFRRTLLAPIAAIIVLALTLAACGSSSKSGSPTNASKSSVTLHFGYFPNVTHAPAIVSVQNKAFENKLGSDVKLEYSTFNAGSDAVTAMLAGALDASLMGPNPAINAYQKTNGGVRIISGVASGGASLIVKPNINSAADLKGKKIATPQLGNTQDVALRSWLNKNGVHVTKDGGDATILAQDNAITLTSFQEGSIDAAWVPEPWATRLVVEGGGKELVDERTLWPQGKFTTTVLVVTKKFLDAHPDVVEHLVEGLLDGIDLTKKNAAQAQQLTNQGIQAITGKTLSDEVITKSWKKLTFTADPIASSLQTSADNAKSLGFLDSSDLGDIFDLSIVNKALKARGEAEVAS
ncbi:MAG TPA: ABC transporter substrate-binding protein [Acidimicrobiia bacterium]|nr:ABC transporter substrate-binding protein [Acidimicrobiia bacterium]